VVSILYGMTKCFELVQTGRYYMLKGDNAQVHPNFPVILPDLQVLRGGAHDVDQAAAFQAVEVRTPILPDVVQVLWANPVQLQVAQLDAAGNPPTSVKWLALPVHPKTAVLFFQGVMAREASCRPLLCIKGSPSWTESGLPLS
jgi:hypothetical protein